jgi:hypothetical protein
MRRVRLLVAGPGINHGVKQHRCGDGLDQEAVQQRLLGGAALG